MRITFVSLRATALFLPDAPVLHGGSETGIAILARELASRGEDVHLICCHPSRPAPCVVDGVHLSFISWPTTHGPVASISFYTELFWKLYQSRTQVVYQAGLDNLSAALRGMTRLLGLPYVFRAANDVDLEPGIILRRGRWVGQWLLRTLATADARIAQTPVQHRLFRERLGLDSRVIPNCRVDHTPVERPRQGVLWIGRLAPQKRPELLLEMAALLPDVSFLMIAPGYGDKFEASVHEQAAGLPNLTLLPAVTPSEVMAHLESSHLLLSTSSHEGFPNVFLEACQCATPILSLGIDPDGLLEVEGAGLCLEDPDKLPTTLRNLLADPTRLAAMGQAGRAVVERKYRASQVAGQYMEVFQDVVRRRGGQ
jgi:glycosyltransferase involved in cell wall biosynthesis